MFKFAALVFILGIALTHAQSTEDTTPDPNGMSAMDFHDELVKVQMYAFKTVKDIKKLSKTAGRQNDPTKTGWADIATAMSEVRHIGSHFEEIALALWLGHHEMGQDLHCYQVAQLDKYKEYKDVEEHWTKAMTNDLGCLKEMFASAKYIPVNEINADLHEDDALDISVNILRKTHLIYKNVKAFNDAMNSIADFVDSKSGGDSGTTSAPGSGSDYSTDSGSQSGGDSGSTSAPGSGSDYSTDSGSESGGESGTTSAPGSGSDYSTDSGSESGDDSSTYSGGDSNTTPGGDSSTYSGSDSNTDSGGDSNTTPGSDSSTYSGDDSNTTPGSDSSTDSGSLAEEDKRVLSKLVRFLRNYSQN